MTQHRIKQQLTDRWEKSITNNTCNEYETDNPANPAGITPLAWTANRAANNTIKLPTNSRRIASHLLIN